MIDESCFILECECDRKYLNNKRKIIAIFIFKVKRKDREWKFYAKNAILFNIKQQMKHTGALHTSFPNALGRAYDLFETEHYMSKKTTSGMSIELQLLSSWSGEIW